MAITLTPAFLAELKKNSNAPNVIIEVTLDSGVIRWGFAKDANTADICLPVLKSVSSLQNKIDTKTGYSTRGQLTVVITGRDNFKGLIAGNYLKNRRVTRKDGFLGLAYTDYAATFTGRISDWSRHGDDLTITVSDDLIDASKKVPVENAAKTQYIDYRNTNPVDVMTNLLLTQLGISGPYVDSLKFTSERDTWLSSWAFDRVLTEPKEANEYLNELQAETNSFIVHDGEKISFKVFGPAVPSQTVDEWTDNNHILSGTLSQKSGYRENFFNRVVLYYDYDESGNDKEENYEAAYIYADAASQSPAQWNEVKTKTIKSKWIKTRTHTETANITGVKVYHVSRANGTGAGTLTFNKAANQLQYTAPGGTIGEAVTLSKDGKFQVFSSDKTKYVRVIVTTASLPAGNASDTVTITAINGDGFAASLSGKLMNRYRDPVSTVAFDVDINNAASNSAFIKPTDLKDITTDEACEKGGSTWNQERVMLTSIRPDFQSNRVNVEAVETRIYKRYGFIAPPGLPDYGGATPAQRNYAYIGTSGANRVNNGTEDGFYIL